MLNEGTHHEAKGFQLNSLLILKNVEKSEKMERERYRERRRKYSLLTFLVEIIKEQKVVIVILWCFIILLLLIYLFYPPPLAIQSYLLDWHLDLPNTITKAAKYTLHDVKVEMVEGRREIVYLSPLALPLFLSLLFLNTFASLLL